MLGTKYRQLLVSVGSLPNAVHPNRQHQHTTGKKGTQVSHPFEVFGSQNLKDDDGQVIDSLLIETDTPPNPADAPQPITEPALQNPEQWDRLLGTQQIIQIGWDPILLLPADAHRQAVTIYVTSIGTVPGTPIPTDGIRIADESGKVYNGGRILHGQTISINYKGPLYALGTGGVSANAGNTAAVSVEVWAVTE
jgi:hypothetical protein